MTQLARRALPQVTLVAVDTRSPVLAAQALARCMQGIDFARVVLFTQGAPVVPPGIELCDSGPVRSGADYSRFVLRRLPAEVTSSHVLVAQWDGFVLDPAAWRDDFLDWDYVGAPWADRRGDASVGNGGFSLRSQRLLQAGLDPRIVQEHPEDIVLTVHYRALLEREHGVRFAPRALARRFAFENLAPDGPTFGFHGAMNLPRALDEATLRQWMDLLPDDFFRGRDARRLARAALALGMPALARQVVARRMAAGRREPATRLLGWAARLLDHGRPTTAASR